jgi:hypothetical protein
MKTPLPHPTKHLMRVVGVDGPPLDGKQILDHLGRLHPVVLPPADMLNFIHKSMWRLTIIQPHDIPKITKEFDAEDRKAIAAFKTLLLANRPISAIIIANGEVVEGMHRAAAARTLKRTISAYVLVIPDASRRSL